MLYGCSCMLLTGIFATFGTGSAAVIEMLTDDAYFQPLFLWPSALPYLLQRLYLGAQAGMEEDSGALAPNIQ